MQDNPDPPQRKLAEILGMSVGGLNYCLNALIDMGIAEKVALTSRLLKRKTEEYGALKVEIESLKLEAANDDKKEIQQA